MAIQATISIVDRVGISAAMGTQLEVLTRYALDKWGAVLAGNATATVEVSILETTPSGRANGGNVTSAFLGKYNGYDVYEPGIAYELRTGLELGQAGPDITVVIAKDYLLNVLFLDPTPQTADDLPSQRADAVAVLMHEIGHALGFIGYYTEASDTFLYGVNTPYDTRVAKVAGHVYFAGPNEARLLGDRLPLTAGNFAHYGNTSGDPRTSGDPLTGLMNGVVFYPGYRYAISALDLAVMADLGVGTIANDLFDQPYMREFNGGLGNDTVSYARTMASVSVSLAASGEQNMGNGLKAKLTSIENLIGSEFADTLSGDGGDNSLAGGAGDDILNGAGGNDVINGDGGVDTVIYSGRRADYMITREAQGYRLIDQRAGGGDGSDLTVGIEKYQFADGVVLTANLLPGLPNTVPVITSRGAISTLLNTGVKFAVTAVDADRDPLVFTASASPAHGKIVQDGSAFSYVPDAGFTGRDSFAVTVSDGRGGIITQIIDLLTDNPPLASDYRFIMGDGLMASIGGAGEVLGSNLGQHFKIRDLPGAITFDASFNRGGDIIDLSDKASSAWQVQLLGSTVRLFDGDTLATIPVGTAGTLLRFADGDRLLKFDTTTQTLKIDNQMVGAWFEAVSGPAANPAFLTPLSPTAQGTLILKNGNNVELDISAGGSVSVLGNNDPNVLSLLDGTIILDGSFNRGGDQLRFDQPATDFSALLKGSAVTLDSPSLHLTIPIGTTGIELQFSDGDRKLFYDLSTTSVLLGSQSITSAGIYLA